MQTMTAAEAKQKFGQLMDKAQRGPVAITKHGRRVGVFMADDCDVFNSFEPEKSLEERLAQSEKDLVEGNFYPAEEVFAELRGNIKKWAKDVDSA